MQRLGGAFVRSDQDFGGVDRCAPALTRKSQQIQALLRRSAQLEGEIVRLKLQNQQLQADNGRMRTELEELTVAPLADMMPFMCRKDAPCYSWADTCTDAKTKAKLYCHNVAERGKEPTFRWGLEPLDPGCRFWKPCTRIGEQCTNEHGKNAGNRGLFTCKRQPNDKLVWTCPWCGGSKSASKSTSIE